MNVSITLRHCPAANRVLPNFTPFFKSNGCRRNNYYHQEHHATLASTRPPSRQFSLSARFEALATQNRNSRPPLSQHATPRSKKISFSPSWTTATFSHSPNRSVPPLVAGRRSSAGLRYFTSTTAAWKSPGSSISNRPTTTTITARRSLWTGRLRALQASLDGVNAPNGGASVGGGGGLSEAEEEAARSAILDRALKMRQPSELPLRCTILDVNGNVKTISGRFKKSDLCTEHRLNPRDLRKIDVPNLVPTILVRKEGILINVLHIRALIKADTIILFDTYGSTETRLHSIFLYHLEGNLKTKSTGLPYEFLALDSILLSVLSALEAEMVFMRHLVGGLLGELEDDIDRDKFKRLLHYSRRLAAFQNRAKLVQEALDEVLEQDEDLAAMYLTDKKAGTPREVSNHEELEVLLESYSKQVEEIVNESETTITNVQSTQEIVELILDSNRNALLALDLKISIATMGIGFGALVASFFGMNLTSHIEDHPWAFSAITTTAALSSIAISYLGIRTLHKIRRGGLSSSNGHGSAKKDSWKKNQIIGLQLARLHAAGKDRWMSQ